MSMVALEAAEPLGAAKVATQRSETRKQATTAATAAMRLTKAKQVQRTQASEATAEAAVAVRRCAAHTGETATHTSTL